MRSLSISLVLLVSSTSFALQLPFEFPFFGSKQSLAPLQPENAIVRIAIIGAGAGGSSAAFWISKAKERYGVSVDVDVYEKEGYIGGSE
jgi:prenylcysteine oxidase/farnesylcysteine lyase